MPQRMKDFGRVSNWRMFQTITTAADIVEGLVTIQTTEVNILEMVTQNFTSAYIEGRNADTTTTLTLKIYGTRKFNESVPATGDTFWTVTGAHWALLDTQTAIAAGTNAVPKEFINKGYTYMVVTGAGSGANTDAISRAILTTY